MKGLNCHARIRRLRNAGQASPGVFLSLLALLPYILLPMLFFGHLARISPGAVGVVAGAGSVSFLSQAADQSAGLPHDTNSCPICRAAESSQDYEFTTGLIRPNQPLQGQLTAPLNDVMAVMSAPQLAVSVPRAPPACL